MAASFVLLVYVSLHIGWVKWRMNKVQPQAINLPMVDLDRNPQPEAPREQNHQESGGEKKSEDIVTAKGVFIIFITGILLGSVVTLRFNSNDHTLYLATSYILQDLFPFLLLGVLLPGIGYMSNSRLRSYAFGLLTRPY